MRRNKDKIVNSVPKKYELTRDKWTTYGNFKSMYDHVIHEMVEAKVSKKLEVPVWQDQHGNVCDKSRIFDIRIKHKITKSE